MEGSGGDAISMDELIEAGLEPLGLRVGAALAVGHPRRHLHLHLHVGHHRPAQGLRDLARQLPLDGRRWRSTRACSTANTTTYLFLPLAHSFALLIQLLSFDLGGNIAYWERDPLKIIPNLVEVKPDYFPSVPRIFEKIYTAATSEVEKSGGLKKLVFNWAIGVGKKVRQQGARRRADRLAAAQAVRDRRQAGALQDPRPVRRPDQELRHRRRPDQPGDPALLRRRRRPDPRGLGHDRDLDRRDRRQAGRLQVRQGRPGVQRLRDQDRRRRRDPGQGARTSSRATTRTRRRPARPSRAAGCTPATSASSTRTATSRSPAARRTSSSPRAARTSRRRTSRPRSSRARTSPSAS